MEYYDNGDRPDGETAAAPEKRPDVNRPNGTAIASMVCGILGLLLLCCCIAFPLSIILGVAAIVLAILSKKDEPLLRLCHRGPDSGHLRAAARRRGISLPDGRQYAGAGSLVGRRL